MGRGVESGCRNDSALSFYRSPCKATALPSSSYCQAMKMSLPLTPVGSPTQQCCGYTNTTTLSSMTRDVVREGGQPYLGSRGSVYGLATLLQEGNRTAASCPAPPHPSLSPLSTLPLFLSLSSFPLPPPSTPTNPPTAASQVMSFSSYPAFLSSLDDFYIMDR